MSRVCYLVFRLGITVRLLADQWPQAAEIFHSKCRDSLELMLDAKADDDRHEGEHRVFKKPKETIEVRVMAMVQ